MNIISFIISGIALIALLANVFCYLTGREYVGEGWEDDEVLIFGVVLAVPYLNLFIAGLVILAGCIALASWGSRSHTTKKHRTEVQNLKTIWVIQYKDGTADVWDTEKPAPVWPYVDAFDVQDETSKLRLDLDQMSDKAVKLEQALIARDKEIAESERHRQILTQQNHKMLQRWNNLAISLDLITLKLERGTQLLNVLVKNDLSLPPQERKCCVGCTLPGDNTKLQEALKTISIQMTCAEQLSHDEFGELGDIEFGYDEIIRIARIALNPTETTTTGCPACGSTLDFQHMHNAPHGIREMHLAGTERFVCSGCDHTLSRAEAKMAGCVYVFDKEE